MREFKVRDRIICAVVAMAAAFVFSPLTRGQTPEQSGTANGKNTTPAQDLSGVWIAENEIEQSALLPAANEQPPMTPWGQEQFKSAGSEPLKSPHEGKSITDPHLKCEPPGIPRAYLFAGPLEIMQTSNRVFIFYEEGHYWREIWTDGRALPKDPDPTYMGYSVGRWDGDTFIVDTIGFNDRTWLDGAGHPHSEALHVVERIRRLDNDTLQITFLFDDPKAYEKPWMSAPKILKLRPGRELVESFCVVDDNQFPDKGVKQTSPPNK